MIQAGVVPMDTAAVVSELQKTWTRSDAPQWAEAYSALFPNYQLLVESSQGAERGREPRRTRFAARQPRGNDSLTTWTMKQAKDAFVCADRQMNRKNCL